MRLDYDAHPLFAKNFGSAEVNQGLVHDIDEVYLNLCSAVEGRRSLGNVGDLHSLVDRSRKEIARQAPNEEARLFVDELWSSVHGLMARHISFLAKQRWSIGDDRLASLLRERHFQGNLNGATVEAILELAKPAVESFRIAAEEGRLTRQDLSINRGPIVGGIRGILDSAFRSSGVLDVVSASSGQSMWVSGLALELSDNRASWWKHSVLSSEPKTLYAHLDEAIDVPKSIVYLSEVDETNGPTSSYPRVWEQLSLNALQDHVGRALGGVGSGSSLLAEFLADRPYHQTIGSRNFRRLFMFLPPDLRFNSHLGWDVIPGSDLEQTMVGVEEKMLGGPGTYTVFDGGRLFHRGGLVEDGQRLALQVTFGPRPGLARKISSRLKGALVRRNSS